MKKRTNSFINLRKVDFNKGFWSKKVDLVNEKVIPYQWKALNDEIPEAEPSHAIENFRIAAGESDEEFQGRVFQDSDIAKWLEAVSYSLENKSNPDLEEKADEVIDLIAEAQEDNGYLNTYFITKEPKKKWTNLRDWHELYCAGHMIEAAVAYNSATGKDKLLRVMQDFADLIYEKFGSDEDQMAGYPGHEEIELALVKLYQVTGKEKYLELSKFFIDERGKDPNYFVKEAQDRDGDPEYWDLMGYKYNQAHKPVREQEEAVGHAVRAMYLYSGMADLAQEIGDDGLFKACKRLWDNVTHKRMYITGGVGSSGYAESFTFDYDLPGDTAYTETCAAIGLVFWSQRMLDLELNSEYADVMEKALYNGVLSGISLDGEKYFYVNPLEVWPEACNKRHDKRHVKTSRQEWFGCACCPPNIARLMASLGNYVYSKTEAGIFTHLYTDSQVEVNLEDNPVQLIQETDYPWKGNIKITVNPEEEREFTLGFRIPGWSNSRKVKVNGEKINIEEMNDRGYIKIKRTWDKGDQIVLEFPMEIKRMYSHSQVRENSSKVSLQRGPVIYCLEEVDNDSNLPAIFLPQESELTSSFNEDLLGGVTVIEGEALRIDESSSNNQLYTEYRPDFREINLQAIPYYSWNNRGEGEMLVWINEQ